MNKLFFGDNLTVLRSDVKDQSADLIYLDPPFNSNSDYNLVHKSPVGDPTEAQRKAFKDTWHWEEDAASVAMDEVRARDIDVFNLLRALQNSLGNGDLMAYLAMMSVRLLELRRVLKATGSLYLHCDPTASHYLKIILDVTFGPENFRNEVIWGRTPSKGLTTKRLPTNHDVILSYQKTDQAKWNADLAYFAYDLDNLPPKTLEKYGQTDADGRRYQLTSLLNPSPNRPNLTYEFLGVTKVWRWTRERMQTAYDEGLVVQPRPGAVPRFKRYLDLQRGVPLGDIWADIPPLNSQAQERLGYPTQKPLALLERIIRLSSEEGDVVLDPFCGCGTTIHAAEKLGRQWVGIDVAYAAIQVIEDRLATWLPAAKYKVSGTPTAEAEARALAALSPYTFQEWAVGRLGGQSRPKGADRGIDGEVAFLKGRRDYGRAIVSVKAGQNVNPGMVRDLAGVVRREGADLGIFVCVNDPTREMRIEANSSELIDLPGGRRHQIQIVTASDLIRGPDIGIPTALNVIQAAELARVEARKAQGRVPKDDQSRTQRPLPPMAIKGGKPTQPALDVGEPVLVSQPPNKGRRRAS